MSFNNHHQVQWPQNDVANRIVFPTFQEIESHHSEAAYIPIKQEQRGLRHSTDNCGDDDDDDDNDGDDDCSGDSNEKSFDSKPNKKQYKKEPMTSGYNNNGENLICVVCSAPANGYNFDAITCESCKAFFRRNAFRPLNLFRCTGTNSCVINMVTRKKCKKCRIMKCLNLGMRRDWIMTESEREEKRRKIETNRKKKTSSCAELCSQLSNGDGNSMDDSNTCCSLSNATNDLGKEDSYNPPIRRRRRRRRQSTNLSAIKISNDESIEAHSIDISMRKKKINEYTNASKMPYAMANQNSLNTLSAPLEHLTNAASLNTKQVTNSSSYNAESEHMLSSRLFQHSLNGLNTHEPLSKEQVAHLAIQLSPEASDLFQKFSKSPHVFPAPPSKLFESLSPLDSAQLVRDASNQFQEYLANSSLNHQNVHPQIVSPHHSSGTNWTESCDTANKQNIKRHKTSSINTTLSPNSLPSSFSPVALANMQNNSLSSPNMSFSVVSSPLANAAASKAVPKAKASPRAVTQTEKLEDQPKLPDSSHKTLEVDASSLSSSSLSLNNTSFETIANTSTNSSSVDDVQCQLINNIKDAYKRAIQLVKAQGTPHNVEDIETTLNVTELAVRRIIFFFKMISDFRNLDHDLMVTLLKFSMMKLLQIHGVNSYNKKENNFKEPDTDDVPFSAESLESVYGSDVYKTVMSITVNLHDLCDQNTVYLKILMLIALFNPLNEALSESEKALAEKYQSKYIALLFAALCQQFGPIKAELKYKGFIYEMSRITELSNWFERTVSTSSNHEYVRPLMKEVFFYLERHSCQLERHSRGTDQHGCV